MYLTVPWQLMEKFVFDVFCGCGVPSEDAAVCTDVLLEADRRGIESHGVNRLKPIYIDRIKAKLQNPVTNFEVVKDSAATAVVDGHNGMGQVIAKRCMQMAIDKAQKFGLGMVAARNSTHYGIAGYYSSMGVKSGCIGITGTNARPSIAPTFGVENMLGTNPLTFGIPSDDPFEFMLDCATSITQRAKIEQFARTGAPTPVGMVIGKDGSAKTDSEQILKDLVSGAAALTPVGGLGEEFGGYKGFGYATVVEILSAALQNGSYLKMLNGIGEGGEKQPFRLGHFFIAINVDFFIPLETFKKITGNILRDLRNSEKAPERDRIYTAGEKEYLAWQERKDKGLPVNEAIRGELIAMRDEFGLKQYKFPFEK